MARIQILCLPSGVDGEQPFAIVVDQCTPIPPVRYVTGTAKTVEDIKAWQDVAAEHNASRPLMIESEQDRWRAFGEAIGARAVVFTAETVALADEATDDNAGPGATHHFNFQQASMGPKTIERLMAASEARRRGDGGAAVGVNA